MSSLQVVPGFYILKDIQTHFFLGLEFGTIYQLCLERFEETFSHCVVPTVPFTAHALNDTERAQDIDRLLACILNAPIRMKKHSLTELPVLVGHEDGWNYSLGCAHAIADGPTYRFAIEKVEDHRQIDKPINGRNVCQVRDAGNSRLIPVKVTVQQVGSHLAVVRRVCGHLEAFGKLAAQSHLLHVLGHRKLGYWRAGHLKFLGQPGTSIAALGLKIGVLDLLVKLFALPCACAFRVMKPRVIRTAGYSQNSTHHLNRPSYRLVVFHKAKDQRSFLEMMLKAFFRISRSVSASYSRFLMSANSLASTLWDCTPLPGKLCGPMLWNSLRHRYSNRGSTPSSCASSDTFLRSILNLTAFSLNALS